MDIVPSFDSSVSPSQQTTISSILQFYDQTFTNPVTISIGFSIAPASANFAGQSISSYDETSYASYVSALNTNAKSTQDPVQLTACNFLPDGNGASATTIAATTADLRALGFSGATGQLTLSGNYGGTLDGVVSVNASFFSTPVIEHEIDEVLGIGGSGSVLNLIQQSGPGSYLGVYGPMDLFRYAAPYVPSFTTDPSAYSYFSINGGQTPIVPFNQDPSGDYGDWEASPPAPYYVQTEAVGNGNPSVSPTSPEGIALQAVGYDVAGNAPAVADNVSGTIRASGTAALTLLSPMTSIASGSSIQNTGSGAGIYGYPGGSYSVINFGTVKSQGGIGVSVAQSTLTLQNGAGAYIGGGTSGVYAQNASITDSGLISGSNGYGIRIPGTGSVRVYGEVRGSQGAVYIGGAGTLFVQAGATLGGMVGSSVGPAARLPNSASVVNLSDQSTVIGTLTTAGTLFILGGGTGMGGLSNQNAYFQASLGIVPADASWQMPAKMTTLENDGTLGLSGSIGTLFNNGLILIPPTAGATGPSTSLALGVLSGAGSITIAQNGTVAIAGAVADGQTIAFANPSGSPALTGSAPNLTLAQATAELSLSSPQNFDGTIANFAPGDVLTLPGIALSTNSAPLDLSGAALASELANIGLDLSAASTTPLASDTFAVASLGGQGSSVGFLSGGPVSITKGAQTANSGSGVPPGYGSLVVPGYGSAGTAQTIAVPGLSGSISLGNPPGVVILPNGQGSISLQDSFGTISLAGSASLATVSGAPGAIDLSGGTLESLGDAIIANPVSLAGSGTLVAASGSTLYVPGSLFGAGTLSLFGNVDLSSLTIPATIFVNSGADTISAKAGGAFVAGGPSASLTFLGAAGSATVFGGGQGGLLEGGAGSKDVLVATGGATTLLGGAGGADTLVGGGGNAVIAATPNDLVFASGGSSTVFGTASGSDTLVGGGSGAATMVGSTGNDVMWGGNGDILFGGIGNEILGGGPGASTVIAGAGASTLVGGPGNQEFIGANGESTVFAGSGNSTVFSGSGSMLLVGQNGPADTFVLQSGLATIFGGTGTDMYDIINGTAGGQTTVAGFNPGEDAINLFGYTPNSAQLFGGSGNTALVLGDGTTVTFLGTNPSQIGPAIHYA